MKPFILCALCGRFERPHARKMSKRCYEHARGLGMLSAFPRAVWGKGDSKRRERDARYLRRKAAASG